MGVPEILLQTLIARPHKMRISVELAYVHGRETLLLSHRVTEGNEHGMLCAGTGAILLPETIRETASIVSAHTGALVRASLAAYAPELDPPF